MTREQAEELADFINRCSDQYWAESLPLGECETWILLVDRQTGERPPPIIDIENYLQAASEPGRLPPACYETLSAWSNEHLGAD